MAFKGARWATPRPDALQRSTNDCGVAVLAEALRGFRIEPPSYATLARTVRVAARGVTIDALSDGLDSFGIPTTRATYADLAPHRGPLIALLTYRHFVLVRDVDRESVRFFDPLIGEVTLERAAFVSLWKGKGLLLRAPSA
jgi:ABC-type bacteriocin/lantibiotic exporter with double-glycine peptidase domain